MLYRKIRSYIEDHLRSDEDKILLIEGARQIGKSYIIRDVGTKLYKNYVEINFVADDDGEKIFKNVHTTEEFYLKLSMVAGSRLDKYENTVVAGGKIVVDSSLIERKVERSDVDAFYIPATKMANEAGIPTLANMIMLGKLIKETGAVDFTDMNSVFAKIVSAKRQDLIASNLKALEIGYNYN